MVWYPHLFQNFPQFVVIHTVKGFGIVNNAEIDVFLELFWFFDDPYADPYPYHEKHWDGRSTSWNQDHREKYQ